MNNLAKLADYFVTYPFVRYAFVVGLLIALCASLLGVTLVLKRFSFIGDGLSHVAFGAMAVAAVTGLTNKMIIVLPVTVLSAILLLRTGQNTKIKGDAAVAMISVGALAVGYMLMNVFPSSSNISGDVCSTLFGSISILTLRKSDVALCVVMAVIVILMFLLFYHKIFAVTFDESFAQASGIPANGYNLLIAVITSMIIVLAMNLVGSLLISALIFFRRFRQCGCSGASAASSSALRSSPSSAPEPASSCRSCSPHRSARRSWSRIWSSFSCSA